MVWVFFHLNFQVCGEIDANWSNTVDYQSVTNIELEWLQLFNWKTQELQLI